MGRKDHPQAFGRGECRCLHGVHAHLHSSGDHLKKDRTQSLCGDVQLYTVKCRNRLMDTVLQSVRSRYQLVKEWSFRMFTLLDSYPFVCVCVCSWVSVGGKGWDWEGGN